MQNKLSLLAGAAVGVVLVTGVAAPAQAKPVKKHAAATSSQAAELAALKAQVQALTERLNAQEAAQAQTQSTAQAAQTQAQAATDQVAQVQTQTAAQIQAIPTQVKTEVAAATPKPKTSWADNTVVSGRMYYDLSSVSQKSNGVKTTPSGTGFDIKRFYVGIDHKFNDVFSANVTTDFQYSSAISATELYIKKAYLQAKVSDALVLKVGSADLPWVPFVEDIYGYRYVENTLIDRTKFGTSADWGVHASGKFMDGKVNYAVSVIDGAGYKAPLRSRGMDIEGRLSVVPIDHVTLAVGGYSGKLGKDTEGATNIYHTANRFNALAAYTTKQYRLGVEYFSTEDWNNVTTTTGDKADGYSVFGSYSFTDQISAFGRYDYVKPNKDTADSKKDNYFNVGLTYSPAKIVDLSLVYKRDSIENGTLATSNGTIGGSDKGTYDEVGLFGQFRF
ncbi:hypothetical protein [Caulobacter soli]|uniref:hypothetical protein n=1 Tax=Caulobacter soli TaxID=2708539 RepID=UPI0013EE2159|nr:hypothetical protein [Caulobacter soli]